MNIFLKKRLLLLGYVGKSLDAMKSSVRNECLWKYIYRCRPTSITIETIILEICFIIFEHRLSTTDSICYGQLNISLPLCISVAILFAAG